jgi:hypothetical protein
MKDEGLQELQKKIKEIGFQTSPRSAAEAADMLYNTRAERLELQHEIDNLAARETALKEYFISNLPKSQASGIAGKVARVQLGAKVVPQVADWPAFYKYVKKNDAFYLMQKRLSESGIVEIWEDGKKVPGVEKFNVVTVSCTAVKS